VVGVLRVTPKRIKPEKRAIRWNYGWSIHRPHFKGDRARCALASERNAKQ